MPELTRRSPRRVTTSRCYPRGYTELLEQQQRQLISGLLKLYENLQNVDNCIVPIPEPSQPVLVHDILAALDMLDTDRKQDKFGEVIIDEEPPATITRDVFTVGDVASLDRSADCPMDTNDNTGPGTTCNQTGSSTPVSETDSDLLGNFFNHFNERSYFGMYEMDGMAGYTDFSQWANDGLTKNAAGSTNIPDLLIPPIQEGTCSGVIMGTLERSGYTSVYYPSGAFQNSIR